ncbi:hypothetical protein, partial [Pseudomonas aeruginosa]|uniref:hypothetical protein n=1 Tax=Pseudomonas aeruginosa TaxID=287 RepID=UPI001BD29010
LLGSVEHRQLLGSVEHRQPLGSVEHRLPIGSVEDVEEPALNRVEQADCAVQCEVGINVIHHAQDIRFLISRRKIDRRSRPEADTHSGPHC